MLKSIACLALVGVSFSHAQQMLSDPSCTDDANCTGSITCNFNGMQVPNVPGYFFCSQPDCNDDEFNHRRVDGICNNRQTDQAYFGAFEQQQTRAGAGANANMNSNENPLGISDLMLATSLPTPNTFGMSNLLIIFGQFIDHDITLIEIEPETIRIPGVGSVADINFPLSRRVGGDSNMENPQFSNEITSLLDLTQVYGVEEEREEALRQGNTAFLRVQSVPGQDRDLLPRNNDLPGGPISMAMGQIDDTFAAGDIRANEQSILTAYHTLFVRNHNKLAQQFLDAGLSQEESYENAKNRNIATYQNIVFNEFLPSFLGGQPIPPYTGYDSSVNMDLSVEFTTAIYRMGHSGVADTATAIDSNGVVTNQILGDVFFNPSGFLDQPDAVGAFLLGAKQTCHERIDLEMQDSMRRLLFGNVDPNMNGQDLGALNIQRSRDHQLTSMNTLRAGLGMDSVNNIRDLSDLRCVDDDLVSMFGNSLDEVPLFVQVLAETPRDTSQVGPTIRTAMIDVFTRLRDGDRYYFENPQANGGLDFTEQELIDIRATTLSAVIQRNTFLAPNQIGVSAFESEQCCFRGGNDAPNMMCVRNGNAISMQVIDRCDVRDMAASGSVFYPGTVDPASNVQYDCNCQAAAQVSGSTKSSATAALFAAGVASFAAMM